MPRVTHHEHFRSILQALIMKGSDVKELHKVYEVCNQYIRAIDLSEIFDLAPLILTIAMELKINKVTRLKWMEYSNDSQTTPTHSDLLKFLDMQARDFESVVFEQKPLTTTHWSYTRRQSGSKPSTWSLQ